MDNYLPFEESCWWKQFCFDIESIQIRAVNKLSRLQRDIQKNTTFVTVSKPEICSKEQVSIFSDGTALGTHVFCGDKEITGISKLEFKPLEPNQLLYCVLTLLPEHINVQAQADMKTRS